MMQADEIMKHRQKSERDAALPQDDGAYLPSRATLALWVIAEQLYEIRALFGILTERAEGKQ